jgi:RNA polymerase-binding transcription factor DksA
VSEGDHEVASMEGPDPRDSWKDVGTSDTPPPEVVAALEQARLALQHKVHARSRRQRSSNSLRGYWIRPDDGPASDPAGAGRRAIGDYRRAMRNIRKGVEVPKVSEAAKAYFETGGLGHCPKCGKPYGRRRRCYDCNPAKVSDVAFGAKKARAAADPPPGPPSSLEADLANIRRLYLALPEGDRRAQSRVVRALLALIDGGD